VHRPVGVDALDQMPSKTTTSTTTKTAEEKPPQDDPLAAYLQIAHEGDASALNPNAQLRSASLTEGGHSTALYGKSKQEIEERARPILAARGVDI
jgi:hypothetical protein